MDRRGFLKSLATVPLGAQALLPRALRAQSPDWPKMAYTPLGRTGFTASRLVFGCGAALSRKRRDDLLETALEAGVNVFDVGTRRYYNDAERNLAPFLRRHRDEIFLISKAFVPLEVEPHDPISTAQAKEGAHGWLEMMDESLRELGVDHVDAYYQMSANNPNVVGSDEMRRAFETAKQAGKVSHLGLSTHQNAQTVLETAIERGGFSLAMIAITPGGWYDWESKTVLPDSPNMRGLRPLLDRARKAGIGLVGMKAGRYLAGRRFLGFGNPTAFDEHYDAKLLDSGLSPFQRSYAFVLEHGLDVVNADMQQLAHLHENFVAAATSKTYVA